MVTPIPSALLESDPEMRDIVIEFADSLPDRISTLAAHLRSADFQQAESLGHQLKGAGGSYGYPGLSKIGADLEIAARSSNLTGCRAAEAALKTMTEGILAGLATPAGASRSA